MVKSKKMLAFIITLALFSIVAVSITLNHFSNGFSEENLTFTGNENITRNITLPRYSEVSNASMVLIGTNISFKLCYQESANVSTVCGGLNTGSYYNGSNWQDNVSLIWDGNWTTYSKSKIIGGDAYAFINYTKPSIFYGAIWTVKDGVGTANLSIPSDCWDYSSKLVLRTYSYMNTGFPWNIKSRWFCKNNTAWRTLRTNTYEVFPWNYIYEEAIYWKEISYVSNTYLEIGTPDKNFEWNYTGSFNGTNNTGNFSSAINSSLNNGSCDCIGCVINNYNCSIPVLFHSDSAGLLKYSNINIVYTSDTTTPVTSLTPNGTGYLGTNQSFSFSCTDTWSGCDYTTYKVMAFPNTDEGTYNGSSGNVTCINDTECYKRVDFFSKDNAGNQESEKSSSYFKIDKKAPRFIENLTNQSIHHNEDLNLDIDCFDYKYIYADRINSINFSGLTNQSIYRAGPYRNFWVLVKAVCAGSDSIINMLSASPQPSTANRNDGNYCRIIQISTLFTDQADPDWGPFDLPAGDYVTMNYTDSITKTDKLINITLAKEYYTGPAEYNALRLSSNGASFFINDAYSKNDSIFYKGSDGFNVTYYDNSTLFDINATTGNMTDNPTGNEAGNYTVRIKCQDAFQNRSQVFNYEIINDAPTLDTFEFLPSPNDGTSNATINLTHSDSENDTVFNWTKWYKDDIYNESWENLINIINGNFTDGDKLTVSIILGDGYKNTTWVNYSLTMNDVDAPILENISVSSESITFNTQGFLYANCYDVASSVKEVNFYLTDPDANEFMYTVIAPFSGNRFKKAQTFNKAGNWLYTKVICIDTNDNPVENNSVGIIINVPVTNGDGSSSGGGDTVLTCNESGEIWTITTEFGQGGYTFSIPYKNARAVEKPILLTNFGEKELKVNLECEKTDDTSLDICDYITLTNYTVIIPPNPHESQRIMMGVDYPEGISAGVEFTFNIITRSSLCTFKLNNKAFISRLSFSKWRSFIYPDGTQGSYPAIIPAIIAWAVFIFLGLLITNRTGNVLIGVMGVALGAGFLSFMVLIWL